jgi:outer membrane protein
MKKVSKKYKEFIFAVIVMVTLNGCVSKEQYYEDITLSRQEAYQQWQSRKKAQNMKQTLINGELSLQDCIKLTLVNNKMLQSIVQEKEVARGGELQSYSAILPSLSLTYDYLRKDKVGSLGPITFGDVDNYTAGLRVSQPIFDGGSMIAQVNAARLFSLMTDETVRSTVQDVLYLAMHAYHDVLLNQHLLEISEDAVKSSQAHLDSVRVKRKGGVASDFDVLRAEVELSNFEAELIKNKNTINISKANLLKIMGVSQDSEVSLTDELVYVPEEISVEQAVGTAFNNRPDLLTGELDIKYQKELLNVARSQYWPVVSGYYERSFAKPDPHNGTLIDWGYIWNAGISVSFPVFDGFAREGNIIQQKARFKQAQINLIDAEETTLFEITKALLSIHDAREFVQSQRLNLTRAEEGLRLAEVGYREGTNTQVEMIDAQSALTEAKANYYQSIYTHIIAKLDLQKAMGTLAVLYDVEQPTISAEDSDVISNIQ